MGFNNHDGDARMPLPPLTYSHPSKNLASKAKLFARGKYWECQKNHTLLLGKHAIDGCGEFMAAGEEGTMEALFCMACTCHRNFHRKEEKGDGVASGSRKKRKFIQERKDNRVADPEAGRDNGAANFLGGLCDPMIIDDLV